MLQFDRSWKSKKVYDEVDKDDKNDDGHMMSW